jgi:hypothetical protein
MKDFSSLVLRKSPKYLGITAFSDLLCLFEITADDFSWGKRHLTLATSVYIKSENAIALKVTVVKRGAFCCHLALLREAWIDQAYRMNIVNHCQQKAALALYQGWPSGQPQSGSNHGKHSR